MDSNSFPRNSQIFFKQSGVKQTLVPPYHPSSNGPGERTVQILKRALRKHAESVRRGDKKHSLKHQLANCLFQYRNTPHSVTGATPSELFLKRKPHTSPAFSYQTWKSTTRTSKADSSGSMMGVVSNYVNCHYMTQ